MRGLFEEFLSPTQQGNPHAEALAKVLKDRPSIRDTKSVPRRSALLVLLKTMEYELKDPAYGWLADCMAGAWAGEDGWDRQTLVDALGRDRQQTPPQPQAETRLP